MKILAVGDFHGKFPSWIPKVVKKEKIDIVVSNGDYMTFTLRKEFFEHVWHSGSDKELWEYVGKKKFKESEMKDVGAAERVFKKLSKLGIPVFSVVGNNDRTKWEDAIDQTYKAKGKKKWAWPYEDRVIPLFKKHGIVDINYSYARFGDYIILGGGPSSFPGRVKSKNYKKLRKKLDKLFHKFRKENKEGKVIFVSHNVPYKTRLDKITAKDAPESAKGRHYGSKLVRRVIESHQPLVHLAGHIHEGQGKQKLGKTLCVNTGGTHDGECAIVEIKGKSVGVRFVN